MNSSLWIHLSSSDVDVDGLMIALIELHLKTALSLSAAPEPWHSPCHTLLVRAEVMLQHPLHHELSRTSMLEVVREPIEVVWQHLPQYHLHHELLKQYWNQVKKKSLSLASWCGQSAIRLSLPWIPTNCGWTLHCKCFSHQMMCGCRLIALIELLGHVSNRRLSPHCLLSCHLLH